MDVSCRPMRRRPTRTRAPTTCAPTTCCTSRSRRCPARSSAGASGTALLHFDYYQANPGALFDIGQGGLQLSLAVVGGILTASIVAGLLGAPLGRWIHALALPLLLALAGRQGSDDPRWQRARGSPWTAPGRRPTRAPDRGDRWRPQLPSWPSQAYEALAAVAWSSAGVLPDRAGRVPRARRARRSSLAPRAVGHRPRAGRLDLARSARSSGRCAWTRYLDRDRRGRAASCACVRGVSTARGRRATATRPRTGGGRPGADGEPMARSGDRAPGRRPSSAARRTSRQLVVGEHDRVRPHRAPAGVGDDRRDVGLAEPEDAQPGDPRARRPARCSVIDQRRPRVGVAGRRPGRPRQQPARAARSARARAMPASRLARAADVRRRDRRQRRAAGGAVRDRELGAQRRREPVDGAQPRVREADARQQGGVRHALTARAGGARARPGPRATPRARRAPPRARRAPGRRSAGRPGARRRPRGAG